MMAIGCLLPVFLFLGGAVLGGVLAGQAGSIWGAAIGLVIGTMLPAIVFFRTFSGKRRQE